MLCAKNTIGKYVPALFIILIATFTIMSGYPITYLAVLVISPLIWMAYMCGDRFALALLSIFTGVFIGHHSALYIFPERALFHNFLSPIDRVAVSFQMTHGFAVFHNMWQGLIRNFPPLEYALPIVYITILYIALLLLADAFRIHKFSILPFLLIFALAGNYGFIASLVFGVLALYLLMKGATIKSMAALVTSVLFGTRGLMAFGLPYFLLYFAKLGRIMKVLLIIVIVALLTLLYSYISNYVNVVATFLSGNRNLSLDWLMNAVTSFYTRERLQPWLDFVVTSSTLITLVVIGFVLSILKKLYVFALNIAVLMALFGVTFIARLSAFENPASDIPYYFLYASAINSAIVFAISNARKAVVVVLFVLLFIGLIPKHGYDAFYEQTFDKIHEYYSLVSYIMTYGANNRYLYDYGSFPYGRYLPNSTMLQPWQTPSRFTNSFYIYSQDIHSMRMFFTLPHIQSQLRQHVRSNIVYDSGQYQISQIK